MKRGVLTMARVSKDRVRPRERPARPGGGGGGSSRNSRSGSSESGGGSVARREGRQQRYFADADVATLIGSLDRAVDQHLFARDVVKTYPRLADEYIRRFPERCDLETARLRAVGESHYSFNDPTLERLKGDVQLMASNCIAFNGDTSAYAQIARNFLAFALEKINAFVESKQRRSSVGAVLTRRDVARLVDSLRRPEDQGAFEVDVGVVYPELKEAYDLACPNQINLVAMRQRCHDGVYTGEVVPPLATGDEAPPQPAAVVGDSIATCLGQLRADVELIVRNCKTFNAQVPYWVAMAESFQQFAHRRIDQFVAERLPSLKGTQSGVDLFVRQQPRVAPTTAAAVAAEPASAIHPEEGQVRCSEKSPSAAATQPADDDDDDDGHGGHASEVAVVAPIAQAAVVPPSRTPCAAPAAITVELRPPVVQRTLLQPAVRIPAALRERLISEHLTRDKLRAALVVPAPEATGAAAEAETVHLMSCKAVLDAFTESVRDFYAQQRTRADFTDAFAYSLSEETFYYDCIDVIRDQFKRAFPQVLLYAAEKADVCAYASRVALRANRSVTSDTSAGDPRDAVASPPAQPRESSPPLPFDEVAHVRYLVRFLVHFPQLGFIACSVGGGTTTAGKAPKLRSTGEVRQISHAHVAILGRVTRVVEELLAFIERYEAAAAPPGAGREDLVEAPADGAADELRAEEVSPAKRPRRETPECTLPPATPA